MDGKLKTAMRGSHTYFWSACVAVVSLSTAGAAANGAEADSLFDRPAPAAAAQAPAGDAELGALQLSGISSLGGTSMFNFVDPRSNKSFWVPLNGSTNGFSVTAFDEKTVTVTVARNGQVRSMQLRQAQIAAMPTTTAVTASPTPVSVPARPPGSPPMTVVRTADGGEIANPKTPQEIAQAEMEARMMVSDLLEISMQERARQKALREAQQKAGQGAAVNGGR